MSEIPEYKQRIYSNYVTGRKQSLAPSSIAVMGNREKYLTRLIQDHFPKDHNSKILDLGCGHGTLIYFANKLGYNNIKGVDLSEEQVNAAKDLGISNVHLGDLFEELKDAPDSSFDTIITFDVIEHLTREELFGFGDEVFRVLRPSGSWIIHVPNGESPFFGKVFYGDLTHEMAFTQTSINQFLKTIGFARVDCFEDKPVPKGLRSTVRSVLWNLLRYPIAFFLVVENGSFQSILSQNLLSVARKQ